MPSPLNVKRRVGIRYKQLLTSLSQKGFVLTSDRLLNVIGTVQYGTWRVFYKIVPHFDEQAFRQYRHQVMDISGQTGKAVVLVAERSGSHWAHKLASTL